MKKFALLVAVALATIAYADSMRAKSGTSLTYLLNGSPQYRGTIINYDGGFTQNNQTITTFNLDNTAFILVQCDNTTLACNAHVADGGCTVGRAFQLDTNEKFLVGALQDKVPVVAVRTADAGTSNCKVFEIK